MPKLLQKSILKSSAIAFIIVCSFVLFICISLSVNASISICGMYAVLNMLLFFAESHNLNFSLCSVELPEYIFIAPYSREERIHAIRKLFHGKFIGVYGIVLCTLILPIMVWSIINGRAGNVMLCVMESIICASMCYSGMYYSYLSRTSMGADIYITVARFLEWTLYTGFTDMSQRQSVKELINKLDAVDTIMIVVIMTFAVSSIVVCRRKYWETMTINLADYEYSKALGKRGR